MWIVWSKDRGPAKPFCHCERSAAISLFVVCLLWTTEINTFLVMTC